MAKYSGATWRPISINFTKGGQASVRGLVVHIMAGTLVGTDSWFRNSKARASSHFGTNKTGTLYQWVDTADRAWAQANGNSTWLSIENEGQGGDTLTDAQINRIAEVFAWVHKTYNVPLQVASGVNGKGLGYHAMGGSSWGGHTSCPGSKIVAQLPEIVKRAKVIVEGKSSGSDDVYTVVANDTLSKIGEKTGVKWQTIASLNGLKAPYLIFPGNELKLKATPSKPAASSYQAFPGAAFFLKNGKPALGKSSAIFTRMGKRLIAKGFGRYYSVGAGPKLGQADVNAYEAFQRSLGYTGTDAKWPPGKASWDALKVPKK